MTADEVSAEGGGEGANATVVFDTNKGVRKGAAPSGPTAKLIVNKGPKQGAEFTLGPGETSIGRNADNTIVIPDISVSRKHVVLVKQGAGYTLQDQGSGNGTLLNGSPVGRAAARRWRRLQHRRHGDPVRPVGGAQSPPPAAAQALPTTWLWRRPRRRIVAPVGRQPPLRAQRPAVWEALLTKSPEHTGQIKPRRREEEERKPPLKAIAALMGVALLLGLGWKVKQNRAEAAQKAEEEAQDEKRQRDAVDVFKAGKELAQKGLWKMSPGARQVQRGQGRGARRHGA